jgi:hypothetical protein
MAYFIDLFSPETHDAFTRSPRDISGFRLRHKNMAQRIKAGDVFVCYLTRLCRWFGLLEVIEGPFINDKPIFVPRERSLRGAIPSAHRRVLDIEKAIPIHDDAIWTGLSFTRELPKAHLAGRAKVRGSERDAGLAVDAHHGFLDEGFSVDVSDFFNARTAVFVASRVKQYHKHRPFTHNHPAGAAKLSGTRQHGQSVGKSGRNYFIQKTAEFLTAHH